MPSPYFNIPDPTFQRCEQIINNAINAWRNLVVTVAAENVAMGITQSGKSQMIADALHDVMLYGQMGSLWDAYYALDDVVITPDMAPFITEDRKNWMKNQLITIIATL